MHPAKDQFRAALVESREANQWLGGGTIGSRLFRALDRPAVERILGQEQKPAKRAKLWNLKTLSSVRLSLPSRMTLQVVGPTKDS